ncbi:MAG TPA: helicase C-terminal domain-containing protein [Candidatus Acidoferrales bacterium]|nr:helicase C-terminal domain-containing protein [Candidatus Acidoferrales bacterium]
MAALNLNPNGLAPVPVSGINLDADVLPPCEYGLDGDKFPNWRDPQLNAIHRIIASERRVFILCAPPGFGKTLAVAGASLMSGRRSAVLTMTKGLEDQYVGDLRNVINDIRGMNNYPCPIAAQLGIPAGTTVTDAPCQCGYKCRLKSTAGAGCGYYDDYRTAQRADMIVTNYACWLFDGIKNSEERGNLQFGVEAGVDRPVKILFCDEAQKAEDALGLFVGVDLSRKECLQLHIQWPDSGWTVEEWKLWAQEGELEGVSERVKDQEKRLRSDGSGGGTRGWSRELKNLRDLKRKLERLAAMRTDDEWIVSESDGMASVRFDPLSPARYAEQALFRGIEKIVLVSATVRPKTATMLGIDPADMEFVEYPSTFPVARRPVIHVPSIRMTYINEQNDELMREWLEVFDRIAGSRLDEGWKGIAHCVSYKRARFIFDNSIHRNRMMIHGKYDKAEVVAGFKDSNKAVLLLSPSLDTGYDFPHDLCRFQILCKLPFASVTDSLVKARKAKDPDYDLYQVAQTLIQMSGRPVRSETDWAETWLIDQNCEWALPKMRAKGFIAKWWWGSFKSVDKMPAPIQF